MPAFRESFGRLAKLTRPEDARGEAPVRSIGMQGTDYVSRFGDPTAATILCSGYPAGLAGREIPINDRVVALADAVDAMTHARPSTPASPASPPRL